MKIEKKGSVVHIHVQDCVASVSSSTSESLFLQGTGGLRSHNEIYVGKVLKQCGSTTNSSLKTFWGNRHKHVFSRHILSIKLVIYNIY